MEDLKETAACGMLIHYTVDENDMISYNDINGRGVKCDSCKSCTWNAICKPQEVEAMEAEKIQIPKQMYIELYNLIDDAKNYCMQKVEADADTICCDSFDITDKPILRAVERIRKYRTKFHEYERLLKEFEEQFDEPE